ncbi:MAG TPA: sigma-54 dependent transcriptional regulator [Candidatus Angelobacter sp.]|jgi:DNA-binding NtrC family response regulator|nr:sigma-54 dependent transcriptional regulator [Candidatus Angelobacter sp.]
MSANMSNQNFRILVVDDDDSARSFLTSVLNAEGYDCLSANSINAAEQVLRQETVQLAFLDLYLGTANGLNVLDLIKVLQPNCACVMMTAQMSVETVAKSLGAGALEYLSKPLLIDDLLAIVRKLQNSQHQSKATAAKADDGPETSIIGRTPKMLEVYRAIARVAPADISVLILGPSGSGKELVARAIHDHSPRAKMPFVPVNCGALPENILESELFGHEKGAFTGADNSRAGLFEAANGGTLFLDEISETRPSFQVNLLRAVQEQQIRRVGSHKYTPINVRILAASNRDLTKMMAAGQFREDLYYRLSVVEIKLPSLEERREDIPLLVQHFLKRANDKNKRSVKITDAALHALTNASWPGNVRELENVVQRLAIFCTSGEIGVADVENERRPLHSNGSGNGDTAVGNAGSLEDMERVHIARVLQEHGGNKSRAASALGIERKTLYQKARRLGIDLQVKK